MEEPLIALGLASNREEVELLVKQINIEGNGEIEFKEFLMIMRNSNKKNKNNENESSLYNFFKNMINGNYENMEGMDQNIPFKLNFSQYRRRKILEAIFNEDKNEKNEKATKILNNFRKQVLDINQKELEDSNDNSIENYKNDEINWNNKLEMPNFNSIITNKFEFSKKN